MLAFASHELQVVAEVERRHQESLAEQARRDGGIFDSVLGRWVEWNEDGPVGGEATER